MIVIEKNLLFGVVLVTLTFLVTTRTSSAASLFDKDDHEKVDVSNNVVPEGKQVTTKSNKLIRVPLYPIRKLRSIDTRDKKINENERNARITSTRNAITPDQTFSRVSDISVNVLKDVKKNYKKLKMAKIQSKNLKNKEHSSDQDLEKYVDKQLTKKKIVRRHVEHNEAGLTIGNMNQINANNLNKYKDAEYFAQRQAVMDRYYARQQEIDKKYKNRVSSSAEYNDRYNLRLVKNDNNASFSVKIKEENTYKQAGTSQNINSFPTLNHIPFTKEIQHFLRKPRTNPSTENNDDSQEDFEYYDYNEDENETDSPVNTLADDIIENEQNDNNDRRIDSNNIVTWGNCSSGKLIYQHNLHLRVHKASMTEANILTSIEGPFCVTCIEVTALVKTKAKVSVIPVNNPMNTVKLRVTGSQDERLSFIVKVFVARKIGDRC